MIWLPSVTSATDLHYAIQRVHSTSIVALSASIRMASPTGLHDQPSQDHTFVPWPCPRRRQQGRRCGRATSCCPADAAASSPVCTQPRSTCQTLALIGCPTCDHDRSPRCFKNFHLVRQSRPLLTTVNMVYPLHPANIAPCFKFHYLNPSCLQLLMPQSVLLAMDGLMKIFCESTLLIPRCSRQNPRKQLSFALCQRPI